MELFLSYVAGVASGLGLAYLFGALTSLKDTVATFEARMTARMDNIDAVVHEMAAEVYGDEETPDPPAEENQ